ncbi:MAG: putative hydrolase or acyltransferases (alpha/beta hydrolase superfamily) [halophilic archaeon J07HX64]|jgi:Predicted hydrolases or acyltransferases (alpha/beta hydrolase superfamily)|nr:MAG: putative hydrolase or acyltransferases (alpha/beta hydrolase superfamily) [halophilic archaeon J07HX64]
MKLRTALLGAAGTVGATVLANRSLRSRADEFEPFLDGEQGTYRWRGFDVGYTEMGDPEDPDVLLLHGISAAASSHEFHRIAGPLSDDYHVLAPDLPGFGHSDRPPLLYSASLYETFVADVIADLTDEQPLVVASSLTGAYTAIAAGEVGVGRLVLVCPSDSTGGEQRVWLRGLLRTPVLGETAFNLTVSKGALQYFNTDHSYYNPDALPDEVVEYEWQTAHQPGARFAPASFVAGFLDPEMAVEDALAELDAPVTLVWGRNSDLAPLAEGRAIAEVGDTDLVVFDRAKLLPHAEHPEPFLEVVRGEVAPEA